MKRLTTAFDVPKRVYPVTATNRPRQGSKPLVFHPRRPETGLLEIRPTGVPQVIRYGDASETPDDGELILLIHCELPQTSPPPYRRNFVRDGPNDRSTAEGDVGPVRVVLEVQTETLRRSQVKHKPRRQTRGAIFLDLTGTFHEMSLGGDRCAMLYADD